MSRTRLLIDSGAFSVQSGNATIDLDDYIRFCHQWKDEDIFFINLDVLPRRQKHYFDQTAPPSGRWKYTGDSKTDVERAAKESYQNYLKMIRTLPEDRIIPVYHQSEDFSWLDKYVSMGIEYLAVGGLASTSQSRVASLQELKDVICAIKNPHVKFHGLGLSSFEDMSILPWYSVDSTSWLLQASYGSIYVPRKRQSYVYDQKPLTFFVSPRSKNGVRNRNVDTMSDSVRKYVGEYLNCCGMKLGKFDVISVAKGYKLNRRCEIWFDSDKTRVIRTLERGIRTSHLHRFWLNARFLKKSNESLPVEDIYFAGGVSSLPDHLESYLKKRLMSYADIRGSKKAQKKFEYFVDSIRRENAGSSGRVS